MTPWQLIDTVQVPGSSGKLLLHQHNAEFKISIEGDGLLMDSRVYGSEDAMAKIVCKKISDRSRPRVLIGGLGMGFTLASALRHLVSDAKVVVAELIPAVVVWNRGPLGELAGHPLQDKRTKVCECDVAKILKSERQAYDAILLDVDNGPEGFTRKKNDWLYTLAGLSASYAALRANGILAVWSSRSDRDFTDLLRKTGFHVNQARVKAHEDNDALHTIWLAERGP